MAQGNAPDKFVSGPERRNLRNEIPVLT